MMYFTLMRCELLGFSPRAEFDHFKLFILKLFLLRLAFARPFCLFPDMIGKLQPIMSELTRDLQIDLLLLVDELVLRTSLSVFAHGLR
jgi:hypothetical protein